MAACEQRLKLALGFNNFLDVYIYLSKSNSQRAEGIRPTQGETRP